MLNSEEFRLCTIALGLVLISFLFFLKKNRTTKILRNDGMHIIGKYSLILCLFILLTPNNSRGQTGMLSFEQINDQYGGLSSNYTNAILQDSRGFIWVGTNNGLNRYDGYESKVFKYDEHNSGAISNDWISTILEDSEGNLWVGTEGGGLNLYIPSTDKFISYRHDPSDSMSISSDIIIRLFEDSQRRIWVGTSNGLDLLNKENTTFQNWNDYTNCPPCNHSVTSIAEDEQGNLWIGDEDYGLYYFDTSKSTFLSYFQNEDETSKYFSKRINDLIYEKGLLWIATDNGLLLFNTRTNKFENLNINGENRLNYHIRRIYLGSDGGLWISTGGSGLVYYHRLYEITFKYSYGVSSQGLSSNSVSEVIIDYSNNLWIATRGGGVNKFNLKSLVFDHHGKDNNDTNSLVHQEVRALHQDEDGIIWVGTNNGVSRYDKEKRTFNNYIKDFNIREDSIAPRVRLIFRSRNNDLWVATISRGLYRYNAKNDQFIPEKAYLVGQDSIKARHISCVYEKEDGVLWFGTDGSGLIVYDTNTKQVKRVQSPNGDLTKFGVLCIEEKSKNEIWVGTNKGLILLNLKTYEFKQWENIRGNKSSLSGNKIRSLFQDENHLWIGSRTGLSKFDLSRETFQQYKISDGLPNDIVYGILPGVDGMLWLSTASGLSRLNTTNMKFNNFVIPQNNDLSMGAHQVGKKGKLIVGGTTGFTIFHPKSIEVNPNVPKVVITDFTVSNLDSEFHKNITKLDSIVLLYDQNNIAIEFSALEFTNSSNNRYQYFLEGFNNNWMNHGTKHDLTFTNLNPGTYTLYLKGSNNDGLWSDDSAPLKFVIRPPWWTTWWAFSVYLVLVLTIFYTTITIRTSYLNRQKEILENLILIRTQELKEKNKRIAEQAKQLHSHTGNLEELVTKRTRELVEKNNRLAEYAFMNAHNLRVPVANIKGLLQLFDIKRSEDETQELIRLIAGQSVQLDKVLYDMQKMLENDEGIN